MTKKFQDTNPDRLLLRYARQIPASLFLIIVFITAGCSAYTQTGAGNGSAFFKGFTESPYFGEQIMKFDYAPEIKVEINAPGPQQFDNSKKVLLVFYALPNMNTIAETIGKKRGPGDDWHYDIQHIGAQIRFLRNEMKDYNIVVAYMATDQESWPWWKQRHPEASSLIIRNVVDSVRNIFKDYKTDVAFSSHSGGGTFIFGYISSMSSIPDYVKRISFIDSEYDYADSLGYAAKLAGWLKSGPDHYLSLIAYDDRHVEINGKFIGTFEGGTYYKTNLMINRLSDYFKLNENADSVFTTYDGLNGRIKIFLKSNPQNLMWHTLLVDKNGFIEGMLSGTRLEGKGYQFWGPRAYSKYIQP